MNYQFIQLKESPSGVAEIRLNRPKYHNAFNDDFLAELITALDQLAKNEKIKVLALTAEGKSFCAGADLNWMKQMKDYSYEENYQDSLRLAEFLKKLNFFPKPTVAKVHAGAYGGGVGLIACVDIVCALKSSKFCFSEVKLGLVPAVISPYVCTKIGQANARATFLNAQVFDAERASHMGLVQHLCETTEELDEIFKQQLETMSRLGPKATANAKQLIFTISQMLYQEGLQSDKVTDYTCQLISHTRISDEAQEGMSALLEKRPAQF